MSTMKACTLCKETKPIKQFYEGFASRDGRSSRCRSCLRAQASRDYRVKNPNAKFYKRRDHEAEEGDQ